jgi:hypothetical protein
MGRGWGWGDRHLPHHFSHHFPLILSLSKGSLDDEDAAVKAAKAIAKAVVMTFPGEMIGVAWEGDARAAYGALLRGGIGGSEDSQGRNRRAHSKE